MSFKSFDEETLEAIVYERSKIWSTFFKVNSVRTDGVEIDLDDLEQILGDEDDEEAMSTSAEAMEVDVADDIANTTILKSTAELTQMLCSGDNKAQTKEMEEILNQTMPILKQHERKWKRAGFDRILDTFDERKIEKHIGDWMRRHNSSYSHSNNLSNSPSSEDENSYACATVSKRTKNSNTIVKMFRPNYQHMDCRRNRADSSSDDDDDYIPYRRHKAMQNFRTHKYLSEQSDRRELMHFKCHYSYSGSCLNRQQLPYSRTMTYNEQDWDHYMQRCHCKSCNTRPKQRYECQCHDCHIRHVKFMHSASVQASASKRCSRQMRRQYAFDEDKLPRVLEGECSCRNCEHLCTDVVHIANSSTEEWLVENISPNMELTPHRTKTNRCKLSQLAITENNEKFKIPEVKSKKSRTSGTGDDLKAIAQMDISVKTPQKTRSIEPPKFTPQVEGAKSFKKLEITINCIEETATNDIFETTTKTSTKSNESPNVTTKVQETKRFNNLDNVTNCIEESPTNEVCNAKKIFSKSDKSPKVKVKRLKKLENATNCIEETSANKIYDATKPSSTKTIESPEIGRKPKSRQKKEKTSPNEKKTRKEKKTKIGITKESVASSAKNNKSGKKKRYAFRIDDDTEEDEVVSDDDATFQLAVAQSKLTFAEELKKREQKNRSSATVSATTSKVNSSKSESTLFNDHSVACNSTALADHTASGRALKITTQKSTHSKSTRTDKDSTLMKNTMESSRKQSDDNDCTIVTSTTECEITIVPPNQLNQSAKITEKGILLHAPCKADQNQSSGKFTVTEGHLSSIIGERMAQKFLKYYLGSRSFDSRLAVYYQPPKSLEKSGSIDLRSASCSSTDSDEDVFERFKRYGKIISRLE